MPSPAQSPTQHVATEVTKTRGVAARILFLAGGLSLSWLPTREYDAGLKGEV